MQPGADSAIFVPGQRVCKQGPNQVAGPGTYASGGYLVASLAGFKSTRNLPEGKESVEVRLEEEVTVVPTVNSTVTCRVSSVNLRFCKVHILMVGRTHLKESFRGMVRKEDTRSTEKDKVEMYKSFRPGDIVLARVLSLGDAQSYVLTTAENELGVVVATSEAGAPMVPVSWCEMQCPKTLTREFRKVARVQAQHIEQPTT